MKPDQRRIVWRGRPILVAAIVLIVGGGLVHLVHEYQINRNAGSLYREALRLHDEEGKVGEAVQMMQRYIEFEPDDLEALEKLGYWLRDVGRPDLAYDRLAQVSGRDPENREIRGQLARLAVRLQRWDAAYDHASEILGETEGVTDLSDAEKTLRADMLLQVAVAQYGLGRRNDAKRSFDRAIEEGMENFDGYRMYANLVKEEFGGYAEALEALDGLVQTIQGKVEKAEPAELEAANHQLMRAHLLRGAWRLGELTDEESDGSRDNESLLTTLKSIAENDIVPTKEFAQRDASDLDGEAASVLTDVLAFRMKFTDELVSRLDEEDFTDTVEFAGLGDVTEQANRMFREFPGDPRSYLMLADLKFRAQDYKGGVEVLRDGLDRVNDESTLLGAVIEAETILLAADGGTDDGRAARIEELIDRAAEAGFTRGRVEYARGRLDLARRRWLEASDHFVTARTETPSRETRLLRGITQELVVCYDQLGLEEERQRVLEQQIEGDPDWTAGRATLAQFHIDAGRYRDAEEFLDGDLSNPLVAIQRGNLELNRKLRDSPNGLSVEEVTELRDRIEKLWESSSEVDRSEAETRYELLLARLDRLALRYEDAEQRLQKLLDESDDQMVWIEAMSLEVDRDDRDLDERMEAIRSLYERAQEKNVDHHLLRKALVTAATIADPEQADGLVELALEDSEGLPATQRDLLISFVADAYVALGRPSDEKRILEEWRSSSPQSYRPFQRSAERALRVGDDIEYEQAIAGLREVEGENGVRVGFLEARRIIDRLANVTSKGLTPAMEEDAERARTLLRRAAEERPREKSVYERELGRLEVAAKRPEDAFDHFEEAFALGDREAVTIVYLCRGYRERNKDDEAERVLQRVAREDRGELAGGNLLAARLRLAKDRLDENQLGKSTSVDELLMAAMLQAERPEGREEVEDLLRQALKVALASDRDRAPGAWVILLQWLVGEGRPEEARQEVELAETELSTLAAEIRNVTLGRMHEVVGDRAEADRLFAAALNDAPESTIVRSSVLDFEVRRGRYEKALGHVDWLLDPANGVSPAGVDHLTRRKAGLLASLGRIDEALALLRSARADGNAIADLRLEAQILALDPKGDRTARLRAILGRFAGLEQLRPIESLQLARLREAGDWPSAEDLYLEVIRETNESPDSLVPYIEGLLRQGKSKVETAKTYVESLRKAEPGSLRTHVLGARTAKLAGEDDEARTLLLDYLDIEPTVPQLAQDLFQSGEQRVVVEIVQGVEDDAERLAALLPERHRLVARWLESLEFTDDAETQLREYAADDGALAPLWLASFLYRQERFAEADDLLEACWMLENRTKETAALDLSVLRRLKSPSANRIARTRTHLDRALEEEPESLELLLVRAEFADFDRDFDAAEAMYRRMLAVDEDNFVALNNLAWLLAVQDREVDQALEYAKTALKRDPDNVELLDTLATALSAANEHVAARATIQSVFDSNPRATTKVRLYRAAWIAARAGDVPAAKRLLNRAEELGLEEDDLHTLDRPGYRAIKRG